MLCNNTSPVVPSTLANVAKPSITPRPASLSSGSTRIARRSSVNTAKPPPPIRRSSSVTPSPNTPTTPTNASTTNLLHQQAHSLNTSTENLPPPPAYLLDGRQTTMLTNNHQQPPPPPVGMPNSSLKVSDTVKALSAGLRHQPASPQTLRRLQQQQQAQQMATSPPPPVLPSATQSMLQTPLNHYHHDLYSPILTTPSSPIILPMHDEPEYDAYYNPYVEVQPFDAIPSNAITANITSTLSSNTIPKIYPQQPRQYHHQYTKSSPVLLSPTSNKKSRTPTPPTPPPLNRSLIVTDLDETPPPLPPPNPPNHQNQQQQHYSTNHHNHQQQSPQLRYHQQQQSQPHQLPSNQQQMPQHSYYDNNGETVYGSKSPTSFRTSSPGGIYAQPKILNNMSSFRTNSPGPNNGHQTPTSTTQSHVPAQPKTNPNLIAQLNARLNSKHQNTSSGSNSNEAATIYGVSQAHTRESRSEDIYMRNYGQQQQPQMSPHVSQQQQTYDDYTSTNTGMTRAKAKAEFLENLNQKLAKQSLSGRAFAVRNLINSKALPDPRICHESLMDQIKRGATLKRNQKINDRSAPKIY
uniref:WH2 domain-containing protein n=1 Tax=Musca domestica TaxID=7370 RepID=T1PN41_MUSDO